VVRRKFQVGQPIEQQARESGSLASCGDEAERAESLFTDAATMYSPIIQLGILYFAIVSVCT
jgi:hypothetical protein